MAGDGGALIGNDPVEDAAREAAGPSAAGGADPMRPSLWRGIWAIIAKDLAIWIRSPAILAVTVRTSLVLVLGLPAVAVGTDPVAIVNLDPGGPAAATLERIAVGYPGFRPHVLDAAVAERALANLQVAAVLTIPPRLSADLAAGRRPTVSWQVRNFNDDGANDLRRALPDGRTTFLASGAAGPDPVRMGVRETDVHTQRVRLVAFQMIAVLAVLLLPAGLVNAGLASAREWQTGSVKELLLSPLPPAGVVVGKVAAGVIAAASSGRWPSRWRCLRGSCRCRARATSRWPWPRACGSRTGSSRSRSTCPFTSSFSGAGSWPRPTCPRGCAASRASIR